MRVVPGAQQDSGTVQTGAILKMPEAIFHYRLSITAEIPPGRSQ